MVHHPGLIILFVEALDRADEAREGERAPPPSNRDSWDTAEVTQMSN